jgi:putative ABC transport system substrate-binding protein
LQRRFAIIVVTGTRESIAAKRATSSIPIVTIVTPHPILTGLAASLARPGGNVTGLTSMDWGIYGKRIEILKQAIPGLSKATVLLSRRNETYARGSPWARDVEADPPSLGLELSVVETEPDDVEAAIASAANNGSQGLLGASDGVIVARRREIAESAIEHRLHVCLPAKRWSTLKAEASLQGELTDRPRLKNGRPHSSLAFTIPNRPAAEFFIHGTENSKRLRGVSYG